MFRKASINVIVIGTFSLLMTACGSSMTPLAPIDTGTGDVELVPGDDAGPKPGDDAGHPVAIDSGGIVNEHDAGHQQDSGQVEPPDTDSPDAEQDAFTTTSDAGGVPYQGCPCQSPYICMSKPGTQTFICTMLCGPNEPCPGAGVCDTQQGACFPP